MLQNSQRNYTLIPCHERVQECQGSKNRSSATITDFLALHISSHSLKLWDASKKTSRYLLQFLSVCPEQNFMPFLCFVREFMQSLVFLTITKFFVRNQNFSYKKSSTQEFSLLLPYPLPYYRIQFLVVCFLKNFPLYSQKSFARKKYETLDGPSAFCSLKSQPQEIQHSSDSDLCYSCQLFSCPSNSFRFYLLPESLIQGQKSFYHS